MAGSVLGYTEGAGAQVVCDDVEIYTGAGVGSVQVMKIASGEEGGTYTARVDQYRGLMVNPSVLRKTIVVQPVVDIVAPYDADDALFDATALTGAARLLIGTGQIENVVLADGEGQNVEADLLFFGSAPSGTYTAGSVFDLNDADAAALIGWVSIASGDYLPATMTPINSTAQVRPSPPIPFDTGGTEDLYVVGFVHSTPTFATIADLTLSVTVRVD